ncbi:unnamed protein product, partial [Musa textilis]
GVARIDLWIAARCRAVLLPPVAACGSATPLSARRRPPPPAPPPPPLPSPISGRIRVRAVLPSALQRGGRPSSHLPPGRSARGRAVSSLRVPSVALVKIAICQFWLIRGNWN